MKLLPCPFCGSEARHEVVNLDHGTEAYVGCSNLNKCNAQPMTSGSTLEEAISAWNTRPDGVVEALKECVEALSVLSDGGTGPGCYAYHRAKKALAAVGGE